MNHMVDGLLPLNSSHDHRRKTWTSWRHSARASTTLPTLATSSADSAETTCINGASRS